jgi:hypothetical protein
MRVRFIFEEPKTATATSTEVASIERFALNLDLLTEALDDLRRLWAFIWYLAHDFDREAVDQYFMRALVRSSLPDSFLLYNSSAQFPLKRLSYASPLEIEGEPRSGTPPRRLRSILHVIRQAITLEAVQTKAHWEAEIARQRAIEAALKNAERALELSKKIKDPELAEEFVRALAKTIASISQQNRFHLKSIDASESSEEKESVSRPS